LPLVVGAPEILAVELVVVAAADDIAVPVEPAAVLEAKAPVEDELDPVDVAGPTSGCSPERGSVERPHRSATSLSVPP
jgi:hypothetical protein